MSLISVYVIIEENGKLLLVEEERKPGWKLPGGVVEKGEFLLETLRREVKEEIGCEIEPTGIVSIQEHIKKSGVYRLRFYFTAKLIGSKKAKKEDEIKRVVWISRSKVKDFSEKEFWKKQYYLAIRGYLAGKIFPTSLIGTLSYRD